MLLKFYASSLLAALQRDCLSILGKVFLTNWNYGSCYVRLASHSLFSDWTGAGEKGLVTLGYSLCKSGMLLNINVTCKLSNLF